MLDGFYIADLFAAHRETASATVEEFSIGDHAFAFNSQPALMGVINLSTDSWYRESVCHSTEAAVRRGRILLSQGAHLIDVGAESTLSHAARADATTQRDNLVPVIRGLRESGGLVSVETYDVEVAKACLDAGANVLNLTGTDAVDDMFRLVADQAAAVIICYVEGRNVRHVSDFDFNQDVIGKMRDYFARAIDRATRCGVTRIFIDPGLGFYYRNLQDSTERVRHQIEVFLNVFRLRTLGWPVCNALPHAAEYFGEEVRCAEPFFAVLAALGKTDLLRTHEVPKVSAVLNALAVRGRD